MSAALTGKESSAPDDVLALIIAGGRGERMRASGVSVPKPLVPVAGTALLEWNLRILLHAGFRRVVIAIGAQDGQVRTFVDDHLAPIAASAELDLFLEPAPLGNIGCAGRVADPGQHVVTVYADNLTTLPVPDVLAHHLRQQAALTLAVHDEPFRLPYGRVGMDDGRITDYEEKPTVHFPVCSAVTVIAPAALALLPPDRPTGLVDLTRGALRADLPVVAYRHDHPWTDVNDRTGIERAESLVAAHFEQFEQLRHNSS